MGEVIQNKPKGKGKNSGKLPGEVAQVDLIMLEWFYKKLPFEEVLKYFNISSGTLTRLVRIYKFEADKGLRKERKSSSMMGHTNQKKGKLSPLFIDRSGEVFKTNQGYEVEIIKYNATENCEYQFTHDRSITFKSSYGNLSKGTVNYPYHRGLYGVGYMGVGEFKSSRDRVKNKVFEVWQSMVGRCYSEKVKERQPRYIGCTVTEEWHNFQNFAKWCEDSYVEGFVLDKDIILKSNKIYSPETCAFVPSEINLLFTKNEARRGNYPIGVFLSGGRFRAMTTVNKVAKYFGSYSTPEEAFFAAKKGKEDYIKQKADEWRDQIDSRVYKAMYEYEVVITD